MWTVLLYLTGAIGVLAALAYAGLRIRPRKFASFTPPVSDLRTVPMPTGLPAPVARFFQLALGEGVPVVSSAIISGRGSLRLNGLRFQSRYRFTHQAGLGYRHYIETAFFGLPLFKVNEHYLEGHARMELPVGTIENDPKTDSAADLALWGESFFLPSVFLTDPRIAWEPVDQTHARLVVPAGDKFDVTFDEETGLVRSLEALRWKAPTSTAKTNWRISLSTWQRFSGILVPTAWAITWQDEDGPWFTASIEEAVYNADVTEYIKAKGA